MPSLERQGSQHSATNRAQASRWVKGSSYGSHRRGRARGSARRAGQRYGWLAAAAAARARPGRCLRIPSRCVHRPNRTTSCLVNTSPDLQGETVTDTELSGRREAGLRLCNSVVDLYELGPGAFSASGSCPTPGAVAARTRALQRQPSFVSQQRRKGPWAARRGPQWRR